MAVEVSSNRKAVEISWSTSGGETDPEPPEVEFPQYPVDPDYGIEEGGPPTPTHPIYLPPYIDIGFPADQPRPDQGLPEPQPHPDQGLPEEQPHPDNTLPTPEPPAPDYSPPPGANHVTPAHDGPALAVQVFAEGQEGDWSNTSVMKNDGLAVLTYPKDFTGESYVEVRSLDGTVVDSGTITVK